MQGETPTDILMSTIPNSYQCSEMDLDDLDDGETFQNLSGPFRRGNPPKQAPFHSPTKAVCH